MGDMRTASGDTASLRDRWPPHGRDADLGFPSVLPLVRSAMARRLEHLVYHHAVLVARRRRPVMSLKNRKTDFGHGWAGGASTTSPSCAAGRLT